MLVNAHYDSRESSPGAADCASCVAVALESARALVEKGLTYPVIYLFNGGEEIIMNAVHGYLFGEHASDPWNNIAAFINLEATGSGGPDVVFRANSDILLRSYMKRAKYPRATVIAQDIFGTGLVPSDTDYSILAGEVFGNLTGMDLASMLDSRSYHCARDVTDRIKRGSVQAYGENVVGVLEGAAELLEDGQGRDTKSDVVYFDILGVVAVSYPFSVAQVLHVTPLTLAAALYLLFVIKTGRMGRSVLSLLVGLVACALSIVLCIALPMLVGAAVCFASEGTKSMLWYGKPHVAALMFVPSSLCGLLLPYLLWRSRASRDAFLGQAFASCFLFSGLSAYLTTSGFMKHSGYIFCFWAMSTITVLFFSYLSWEDEDEEEDDKKKKKKKKNGSEGADAGGGVSSSFLAGVLVHVPPLIISANVCMFAWLFFADRLGLMGSNPAPIGIAQADLTLGAITGFAVFVCVGPLVPWLCGQVGIRTIVILLLTSTSVLAWKDSIQPFSRHDPERLYIQHVYTMELERERILRGRRKDDFIKLRPVASAWTFIGMDATPLRHMLGHAGFSAEELTAPSEDMLLPYYPKQKKLRDNLCVLEGEEELATAGDWEEIWKDKVPEIKVVKKAKMCRVTINNLVGGYHTLRIKGDITSWSFALGEEDPTPSEPGDLSGVDAPTFVVHHVQHGEGSWSWWYVSQLGSHVSSSTPADVTWTYSNLTQSSAMKEMTSRLPEYVTPISRTTLMHKFTC